MQRLIRMQNLSLADSELNEKTWRNWDIPPAVPAATLRSTDDLTDHTLKHAANDYKNKCKDYPNMLRDYLLLKTVKTETSRKCSWIRMGRRLLPRDRRLLLLRWLLHLARHIENNNHETTHMLHTKNKIDHVHYLNLNMIFPWGRR